MINANDECKSSQHKEIVLPEKLLVTLEVGFFSLYFGVYASTAVYLFKCRPVMACHSLITKVTNK